MNFLKRVFAVEKKQKRKQEVWRRDSFTETTRTKRRNRGGYEENPRSKSTNNARGRFESGQPQDSNFENQVQPAGGFNERSSYFFKTLFFVLNSFKYLKKE